MSRTMKGDTWSGLGTWSFPGLKAKWTRSLSAGHGCHHIRCTSQKGLRAEKGTHARLLRARAPPRRVRHSRHAHLRLRPRLGHVRACETGAEIAGGRAGGSLGFLRASPTRVATRQARQLCEGRPRPAPAP